MPTHPMTRHLTDEELLLDYYDESSSAERTHVQAHLEACDSCRALDRELRAVLSAVETTPITEPPSGFERQMWARIEPLLPVSGGRGVRWAFIAPRLGLAASIAALAVASFLAGRVWDAPPAQPAGAIGDTASFERLLRAEVGDHLERSQRVLVELVNADLPIGAAIEGDRARAADLVAASRLYRRSAEDIGDSEIGGLLDDLERVLMEVANGPADAGPEDLARVRRRIDDLDLMFRLRVVATEMQERERRVRQEW